MSSPALNRIRRLACALLCLAVFWIGEQDMDSHDTTARAEGMSAQEEPVIQAGPAAPPIKLEAAAEYLMHFPMLVAITCVNDSPSRTFYRLPEGDYLDTVSPVELIFTSSEGQRIAFHAASLARETGYEGFTLHPHEAREMLLDLSWCQSKLKPGAYHLQAKYHTRVGSSTSASVPLKIKAASPSDMSEAAALRRQSDTLEPTWGNFLQYTRHTVAPSNLSDEARHALALHLFLNHALYGPKPIADLETASLTSHPTGPLAGEFALLNYEILMARHSASGGQEEQRIRHKWPGLQWRLEEIKQGSGLLTRLRQSPTAQP